MTTTAPLSPPGPGGATVGPVGERPVDHRDGPGRLRIDARVVQKLAAQAANEVEGVSRASAGPVARAISRPIPASTPIEQVSVDLDLAVSVRYPLSLPTVVERLAVHVGRRIEELTGRPVGHLSVTVRHLGGIEPDPRPRVR